MDVIKLTTAQARTIVQATFPDYKGRKFSIEFRESITLYDTNWSGGTRNQYCVIASNGKTALLHVPAPWVNMVEGQTVEIPLDAMIVCHSYFCGKDCGITIYAHPAHAPKWITAPVRLEE